MDRQRVLVASILSAAVVLVWLLFFAPKPPPPAMGPPRPQELAAPGATPAPAGPAVSMITADAEASGHRISGDSGRELRVRSELFDIVLSSQGGVPRSWVLPRYHRTAKKNVDDPTELVDPVEMIPPGEEDSARRPLSVFTGDSVLDRILASAVYAIEVDSDSSPVPAEITLAPGEKRCVWLRWADGAGNRVDKTLEFDGASYVVGVNVRAVVRDRPTWVLVGSALGEGADPAGLSSYSGRVRIQSGGSTSHAEFPGRSGALKELRARFGEKWPPDERGWLALLEVNGQATHFRDVGWAALEQNYFGGIVFAVRPFEDVLVLPALRPEDSDAKMTVAVPAGAEGRDFSYFMGPKDPAILSAVRPDLVKVVDLGWFHILASGLLWCLTQIYAVVPNWGVAIILLTVVIKICFLPLTVKQLKTMQKMAKLQPQMKSINDRYARKTGDAQARMENNRQKQQEIMALYSKEGVNPMGGCVPMLLYLPFLYGFFAVLSNAFPLRQAHFIAWITDLSGKEQIPHSPIGVMPILMMISMIVQQAITPTTMDPAQQRIMYLMPVFMTWILKDQASGLVLFWLTNNALSIVQQIWLNNLTRKREAEEKENRRGGKKRSATRGTEAG